jgi:hypothetical protein
VRVPQAVRRPRSRRQRWTGAYYGPGFSWASNYTSGVEDVERRIEEERAKVGAEYRQVLQSSVQFERRIRDRWREKCLAKNRRIAELEERVVELERSLGERGDL